MSQDEKTLKTFGENDPYFYWKMPEETMKLGGIARVEAKVDSFVSAKMLQIAKSLSKELFTIEFDILNHEEAKVLKELQALRHEMDVEDNVDKNKKELIFKQKLRSLANNSIELYWAKAGKVFSEKNKSSASLERTSEEQHFQFDVLLKVKEEVSEVRIDFPDVSGVTYLLNKLELISGDTRKVINVSQLSFLMQNKIKRKENRIEIIGADPHFAFKIPHLDSKLDFVHLQGVIQ